MEAEGGSWLTSSNTTTEWFYPEVSESLIINWGCRWNAGSLITSDTLAKTLVAGTRVRGSPVLTSSQDLCFVSPLKMHSKYPTRPPQPEPSLCVVLLQPSLSFASQTWPCSELPSAPSSSDIYLLPTDQQEKSSVTTEGSIKQCQNCHCQPSKLDAYLETIRKSFLLWEPCKVQQSEHEASGAGI